MNAYDDVARFRGDDDERLVAASFVCPLCLGLDAVARPTIEPDDAEAVCACSRCDIAWSVALDPAQLLRLALHPPALLRDAPRRTAAPRR